MNLRKSLIVALLLLATQIHIKAQEQPKRRSNPIVSHMFTADGSAHVWDDGRLYVYPSTDVAPAKGYKTMDGYHVFSTDDMISWVDHGEILHSRDVSWGTEKGGVMWAPDCVYKNGIYYFYFPHKNKENVWEIGLATSKKPASYFKVQGYVKGGNTFCDPCVFLDDDGQVYLYAVVKAKCYAAKLKDNMMETEGELVLQVGVDEHREGPFVFKRKGKYYMIYPDHHRPGNEMRYSMSDNPLGPWEPKGLILNETGIITMHGSIVEYKGSWYMFYHNGNLSGGIPVNRSICFDPVYFNEDGTIQMVKPTLGVQLPTFHEDINFNGMFANLSVGNYTQADLKQHGISSNGISSIQIPENYIVECFDKNNFKGKSWVFKEDRINLNELGCNNIISSIKITKVISDNIIKNGSFELATQGLVKHWYNKTPKPYARYLDKSSVDYYSLRYQGEANENPNGLSQKVEIIPNKDYEISILLKIEKGSVGNIIFETKGELDENCKFELNAKVKCDEWVEYNGIVNSGDAKEIELRCIVSPNFNGVCYWDNVQLKMKK